MVNTRKGSRAGRGAFISSRTRSSSRPSEDHVSRVSLQPSRLALHATWPWPQHTSPSPALSPHNHPQWGLTPVRGHPRSFRGVGGCPPPRGEGSVELSEPLARSPLCWSRRLVPLWSLYRGGGGWWWGGHTWAFVLPPPAVNLSPPLSFSSRIKNETGR